MFQRLTLVQIAGFIAIFQSLFMAFFTARHDRKNASGNAYLSLALVAFAALIGCSLFLTMDITDRLSRYHKTVFVISQSSFLIGPFVFLYLKHLSDETVRFRASELWHLIPCLLAVAAAIWIYASNRYFSLWQYPGRIYFSAAVFIQNAVYLILVIVLLRSKRSSSEFARRSKRGLTWARLLMAGMAVTWLLQAQLLVSWDVLHLIKYCPYTHGLYLIFGFIFFNALIDFRMRFPDIFARRLKYDGSPLTEGEKDTYRGRLLALMDEEKPYLDSELNLSRLARRLSIAPCHLSRIINESFQINFSDFINRYRARESTSLLERFNGQRNIIDIAYECGFNSKSVFNTAFKKHIGLTPKDFQKQLLDA